MSPVQVPVGMKRKGLLAAFILGLVFGIALGPCTFAYMAPMLAVTFKLARRGPSIRGRLAAGLRRRPLRRDRRWQAHPPSWSQRWLKWNEQSKGVAVLKIVCGILVMLGGVWLIYTAP